MGAELEELTASLFEEAHKMLLFDYLLSLDLSLVSLHPWFCLFLSLNRIRDEMGAELEELTASLFEEAHKMLPFNSLVSLHPWFCFLISLVSFCLNRIRDEMGAELEELTASWFEEAHKMVPFNSLVSLHPWFCLFLSQQDSRWNGCGTRRADGFLVWRGAQDGPLSLNQSLCLSFCLFVSPGFATKWAPN